MNYYQKQIAVPFVFHPKSLLKKETFYNKYKKIIKYYENGNISEKINRNFGVLDGEQLKYTRDGSLISKIIYFRL